MKIIGNELKKIFSFKLIIVLFIVSFIFYQLFLMFDFKVFPNGRPAKDEFIVSQQMIKEYGETLNKKEFEQFKKEYDQKVVEANKYLQSQKDLVAAGINTYDKFQHAERNNEKVSRLIDKVFFENNQDVFWELQAREYMIERYEHPERFGNASIERPLHKGENTRVKDLLQSGSATAILTWTVYTNYNSLAGHLAILIFLSVMIVVTPLYLTDRKNNMILLQYTTKIGRSLFFKKWIAAFIAVMIVLTIQFTIFFTLYHGNNTALFFPIKISSLFNDFISWFDLTFLQYIILTVVSMYVLGIAVLFLVAFISSISPNYMTSIGVQIPLAFILFGTGIKYMVQNVTAIYLPKYILALSLFLVLISSCVLFILKWKREKLRDVL